MEIKNILGRIRSELRTTKGRNILTFLVFLVISAFFWLLMALNDETQQDYRVPVRLEDFPKDMTIISGNVPTVNVTVSDKGSALARFAWGTQPLLKLRYDDFSRQNEHYLLLNQSQLNSAVRGVFGSSATVVAVKPDSLHLLYTTNPGVPVRVALDAEVSTQPQYESFGPPVMSHDSVLIFSNLRQRLHLKEISTAPISLSQISDTTTVEVQLLVPDGMRAIPSHIRVTFPVEPLVLKTRRVNITAVNVPHGSRLIPFPAVTEVTYLLPQSLYSAPGAAITATVNYNDIRPGSNLLPVSLRGVPSYYKSVRLNAPEVEFLIEKSE